MLPKVNLVKTPKSLYALFQTCDGITGDIRKNGEYGDILRVKTNEIISNISEPLVLDIGANLGSYCIPLAHDIKDKGGEIISFEPQRIIFYQLCCNIFLNRLDNIYAYYMAVGKEEGNIEIPEVDYEFNPNIGAFSIIKEYRDIHGLGSSIKSNTTPVPMITLDSLSVKRSPSLIKIDVEGYELNVLKGSVDFLSRHNYPTILFEVWNFPWYNEQKQEIFNFLKALNYDIASINGVDFIAKSNKS